MKKLSSQNRHFSRLISTVLMFFLVLIFSLPSKAQKKNYQDYKVSSPVLPYSSLKNKKGDVDTLWGGITDSTDFYIYGGAYLGYFGDSARGYQFGTTYYYDNFYPATKKMIAEVGMRFDSLSDVSIRQVLIYGYADIVGEEDEYVFIKMYNNSEEDNTPNQLLHKAGVNTRAIQQAYDSGSYLPVYFNDGPIYHDIGSFFITFDVDKLTDDSFGLASTYEYDSVPISKFKSVLRFNYSMGGRWWKFDEVMSSGYEKEEMVIIPVIEYSPNLNLNDLNPASKQLAYPNPTKDFIYLNWEQLGSAHVGVQLVNNRGESCYSKTLSYGESINSLELASGVYYLIINSNGQSVAQLISINK